MPLQISSNDASFLGWLTVAAYLLAAILCGMTTFRAKTLFPEASPRQHRLVWGSLAMAMLFLGLNKQLDWQITFSRGFYWVIHITERLFLREGNAGDLIRPLFIGGLAGLGLLGSAGLIWSMRRYWQRYWLLACGVLLIAGFVVLRAADFYRVELLPWARLGMDVPFNGWLEFLGATVIATAAGMNLWRAKNLGNSPMPVLYEQETESR
ncbi:MAG: hypothetical protein Fur0022_00920 [Anaerolineales bacterium]